MKTTKRKARIYTAMTVWVLLFMVPAMAGAVDYKNQYNIPRTAYHVQGSAVSGATVVPSADFRSTSTYSVQTGTAENRLNADGSVNTDNYLSSPVSNPRRNSTVNPGTPDDKTEEDGERQPLGDVLFPFLIMAAAYIVIMKRRNKGLKISGNMTKNAI